MNVSILATSVATPQYCYQQKTIKDNIATLFPNKRLLTDKLLDAFDNAGIKQRFLSQPLDWYMHHHDLREKNDLFLSTSIDLLKKCTHDTLIKAKLHANDIDAVICVNSTGIATPALDSHLYNYFDFRPNVMRMPLFGLGCAGGSIGLHRAYDMAHAIPNSNILLLVVELCSLTFRDKDKTKSNVIASALFGDGAGAVILSSKPPQQKYAHIKKHYEHSWHNTLDVMGWNVKNDGFEVVFSRDIPTFTKTYFAPIMDSFLQHQQLTPNDITYFLAHPGGQKVLSALIESIPTQREKLAISYNILANYGNMSAATLIFILDQAREQAHDGDYILSSLGPGFCGALTHIKI